jgi:tetratricopeptide (TPR) repeat protein
MDGHFARLAAARSFRVVAVLVCPLLALLGGCSQLQTRPPLADATPALAGLPSNSTKPWWQWWEDKNRTPKPETCVACAEMRLATASNKALQENQPVQVEQLRDEARRAYQQAIKIDNKCLPAYLGLAMLYQDIDQSQRAIETYRNGLKAMPKEPKLWFALGMCQARDKQFEASLPSLKKATELDTENYLYINHYGFTLARAGRIDESYRFFVKTQGEAKAHYNVACVLHHVNRDDECKDHLLKALMAKPNMEPAQELLAHLQNPSNASGLQPASFIGEAALPETK